MFVCEANEKINKLEYHIFLKEQSVFLSDAIRRIDKSLEFWGDEFYNDYQSSWYSKLPSKLFGKTDYEFKIRELKKLKKATCRLLGLFLEYSYFYEKKRFDLSDDILQKIELFFKKDESLSFKNKLERFYSFLERECCKNQLPNYFKRHWASYLRVGVSLAIITYACNYYSIISKCKSFVSRVNTAICWYHEGVFYRLPDEILQGLLHRCNRLKIENNTWFSWKAPLSKPINIWNSQIVFTEEIARALSDYYRNTFVPKAYSAQGVILKSACCAIAIFGAFLGYKTIKGLYRFVFNKQKQINFARYNIRKIHQLVNHSRSSRHEINGALFVHLQMLLESLGGLPVGLAREMYEDIELLNNLSISREEKKSTIDRWYNSYLFLKV